MALITSVFFIEIGSAILLVGFPLFVLQRYGLSLDGALAVGLRYLPGIFLGPTLNYALRHVSPKILASVTTILIAATAILITFTTQLWQVQLLSVLFGLLTTVDIPARLSMRAWVTRPGMEMRVNSLIVTVERVAITIGPLIAAGIAFFVGVVGNFYAQAVFAVPALFVLMFIRRPSAKKSSLTESSTGTTVLSRLSSLFSRFDSVVVAYSVTALVYMCGVGVRTIYLPLLSGGSSTLLGAYTAAFAVGGVLGGVLATKLKANREVIYLLASLFEGMCWLVMVANVPFPIHIATLFVAGIFESAATAAFLTSLQLRLRPESIGPYYGWLIPSNDAFIFLGIVAAGVTNGLAEQDIILPLLIAVFSAVPVLLFGKIYVLALFSKHPRNGMKEGDLL